VPVVGLTGGIGCGQSTVAGYLKSLGAKIINADKAGNELLNEDTIKEKIVTVFTTEILNRNENIDREKLAAIVFKDKNAIKKLNEIMHPVMIEKLCEMVIKGLRSRRNSMIVVDAALIFETGIESYFDYIITVNSDLKKRIERIKFRDKLTDSEIIDRFDAQISLEDKVRKSDYVISNNGSFEELNVQAKKVYDGIISHFNGNFNI